MTPAPASTSDRTAARADAMSVTTSAFFQKLPGPSSSAPAATTRGPTGPSPRTSGKMYDGSLCTSRTEVTPYFRNSGSVHGSTWTCASMRPGSSVRPEASTLRSAGTVSAASVESIRSMRPPAMKTVARGVTRPSPCTTRVWRMARSKRVEGGSTISNRLRNANVARTIDAAV